MKTPNTPATPPAWEHWADTMMASIAGRTERLPEPWFDHDGHRVVGRRVRGAIPWEILQILWRRRGRFVSRETIMTVVYDHRTDTPPNDKIVDCYIHWLRAALTSTPFWIETQYNVGWRLMVAEGEGQGSARILDFGDLWIE
jgi:hypothetical protein